MKSTVIVKTKDGKEITRIKADHFYQVSRLFKLFGLDVNDYIDWELELKVEVKSQKRK